MKRQMIKGKAKSIVLKKIVSLCMILTCVGIGFQTFAMSADASGAGFSVSTVIPENQVDKTKTYFDLQMEKNQEQTLEVNLKNGSDEEVTVEVEVFSATTNVNGVVEYGIRDIELDPSLEYKMHEIIEYENYVTIAPNSTYVLELHVNMPEEEFDGVLAGGITLKEVDEEKETVEEGQMTIENKYAYVVGIVLRENDNEVAPALELDKVFPNQINARNVISANIRNIMPMYMNNMEVEAEITKKGDSEVLYSTEQSGMQMAPNSNFDFPVPLEGQKMKGGTYTIYMTARSMGEEWKWEKDFTITDEEAKRFNEDDVDIEPEDYTWIYILAGVVLLLIVIIVALVVRSKKKTARLKSELERAQRNKE